MPIYDYRCKRCGSHFELLIRGSTTPQCPHCGSDMLDKCVTAPAAPGKSAAIVASARRQASKEGHFSHYSAAERRRIRS